MSTSFKEAVRWLLEHETVKLSTWEIDFLDSIEGRISLTPKQQAKAERVRICPLRDGTASKHRDGRSAEAPNVGLGRRPAGTFLKGVMPICPLCKQPEGYFHSCRVETGSI